MNYKKLLVFMLLLVLCADCAYALGTNPDVKSKEKPIYGLCKFIKTQHQENLKYLIEAYNPTEQIASLTDEGKILESLSKVEKAASHLKSLPEGNRVIYIGGSVVYDLYENGKRLDTQFDMIGKYESPWMDKWQSVVRKRLSTFANALKAAGASVDYIMLDYEEKGPANYEMNKQDAGVWQAVMSDPRWKELRESLGLTDEEFKKGLNKNGDLVGSRTDMRPVAQRWNIVHERMRVKYFDSAITDPFRKHWPDVKVGSYEDGFRSDTNPTGANCFRFTNMWGSEGGIKDFTSFYSSENLRFGQTVNTPQGDLFIPKTQWDALVTTVQVARAAAQVSDRPQLNWLTGYDFYNGLNQLNVGPYYKELLIHVAMNNAENLLFQTSSWSTKEGHETADAVLKEINDIGLGYSDRMLFIKDSISYGADSFSSSVRSNGKVITRISWKIGKKPDASGLNLIGESETGAWSII